MLNDVSVHRIEIFDQEEVDATSAALLSPAADAVHFDEGTWAVAASATGLHPTNGKPYKNNVCPV